MTLDFMELSLPVDEWPKFICVEVTADEEHEPFEDILTFVAPLGDDYFAVIKTRLVRFRSAQFEITAGLAELGYEPAPGRDGRWCATADFAFSRERIFVKK